MEKSTIIQSQKAARAINDADAFSSLTSELATIERQIMLFRRLIDCILAHFLVGQTWILRRLMLFPDIRDIDPKVLRHTVDEATRRNKENRMVFYLVTDLLTAVHIGDLLKVDRSDLAKPMEPGGWEVIELKEGMVNDNLLQVLGSIKAGQSEQGGKLPVVTSLGPKAEKQFERMVRQRNRQVQTEELIKNDQGVDPITGFNVILQETGGDIADYFEVLRKISERIDKEDHTAVLLDKCLYMVGLTRQQYEIHGFGNVLHKIWHMKHRDSGCAFTSEELNIDAEIDAFSSLPGVVDLVDVNLRSGWSHPIFAWAMPDEMICKLAFQEQRIFMWLDYEALFERAKKEYGLSVDWIPPDMKGVKGKTREFLEKSSAIIPGSPSSRGVNVTRDNEDKQSILASGFFNRIYVEHMTPSYLLSLMNRGC